MRPRILIPILAAATAAASWVASPQDSDVDRDSGRTTDRRSTVQLGPRPFFLARDLDDGPLKRTLTACADGPFKATDFSIGHRGAPLQFPEHTEESYVAAARMGAGMLECDVVFTKDRELVCRHAQNDLATTTNILVTPLAATCTQPFVPAAFSPDGSLKTPARAECRTSEITLAEFKTLRGKMDGLNRRATTPEAFLEGTPGFRSDLYSGPTSGQLLSHRESIELFKSLGVKMIPELKVPTVAMPFDGFTQDQLRQKMIDEYKEAGVPPGQVWAQSFDLDDVLYWIDHEPAFGRQGVFLEDATAPADLPDLSELAEYKRRGINVVAPPLFALLGLDPTNRIVPSQYARDAKAAGLDIIAWTLERSGVLADGRDSGFYYRTVSSAIQREGDVYRVLDALARAVGVIGVFSDWPATVTYYDNCLARGR